MVQARIRAQRGFSLVELMVGIVIAMMAVAVVMQVFKVSEGRRRTTAGGDDAQTSGAVAMAMLQRDLRPAGQGITDAQLLGCTLTVPAGHTITNLAGVTINHPDIPAGDANTDTLLVVYGSASGLPEGDRINTQPGPAVYSTSVPSAFSVNDRVIATPQNRATPCALSLTTVTSIPTPAISVNVAAGVVGMANGILFDLGARPVARAYAVRNSQLMVCDFLVVNCRTLASGNWTTIADGVVSLRAQYAIGAPAPAATTFSQTTPSTVAAWQWVLGTRLVIVLRSGQLEKDIVTTASPIWAGAAGAPVTLTGTNWQKYRYRSFEASVPAPNVAWLK